MYYILFNPLSNGGTCIEKANELDVKFTNENKEHKCISLLDITNIQEFLDSLNQDDIIIIVGGDGTLYHIANEIHDFDIKNKIILLAKAGTGNDFYRDIKKEEKEGFVRIDQYITKSPSVEYNDKLVYFNNSCGIGVDGDICNRVNVSKKKSAIHYLFNCLKAVLKFKKFTLLFPLAAVAFLPDWVDCVHILPAWLYCGYVLLTDKTDMDYAAFSKRLVKILLIFIVKIVKSYMTSLENIM